MTDIKAGSNSVIQLCSLTFEFLLCAVLEWVLYLGGYLKKIAKGSIWTRAANRYLWLVFLANGLLIMGTIPLSES